MEKLKQAERLPEPAKKFLTKILTSPSLLKIILFIALVMLLKILTKLILLKFVIVLNVLFPVSVL